MDQQNIPVTQLVLIDLSAAFDTVDHKLLFNTMNCSFGVSVTALNWFFSYLQSRSQRVIISGTVLTKEYRKDRVWVPLNSQSTPAAFSVSSMSTANKGMHILMIINCIVASTRIL